jgi:membrane protein implicated in regulation of membrane protease activity
VDQANHPPATHSPQRPSVNGGPTTYNWVFAIVLVLSLAMAGGGVYLAATGQGWTLLSAGGTCVVATLLAWAIAATLQASRPATFVELRQLAEPISERLEQFSVMLNLISEQQLLSDRGKSIAYRNKDREALRFAIQEEINRGDFEAALKLAEEMDHSFGSRQEADRLRQVIEQRREEAARRHVAEAMTVIDRYVRAEQWSMAVREAEAFAARYPEESQLRTLPVEVENRRQLHKKQLLDSFQDAVNRHDVDAAMVLMKRLDAYLTPAEAESLQETARSIVKAKLESLKDQFARAVHESNWHEALRIGDVIIRDFPNSQMAKEVRDVLDTLKQRASVPAGA